MSQFNVVPVLHKSPVTTLCLVIGLLCVKQCLIKVQVAQLVLSVRCCLGLRCTTVVTLYHWNQIVSSSKVSTTSLTLYNLMCLSFKLLNVAIIVHMQQYPPNKTFACSPTVMGALCFACTQPLYSCRGRAQVVETQTSKKDSSLNKIQLSPL